MARRLIRLIQGRVALKLTLTFVAFVAVALLAAGLYLNRALEALAVASLETRLATAAQLLHDDVSALVARRAGAAQTREFAVRTARLSGSRVTVIAADGLVLGDSEVPVAEIGRLENHRDRPEVRAALAGRQGADLRTSATLAAPLLYVAVPVRDGGRLIGVLRLALPLSVVTASYAAVHDVMAVGGLVALAVAGAIGVFVAGRVTRPIVEMQEIARRMAAGDFTVRAPVSSTDEVGALGRALNAMLAALRQKIEDLEQERAKARAILDGMVEGVIAVDSRESLLLMNERARAMFGVPPGPVEGRPFLEVTRNAELHEIFRQARTGGEGAGLRRELLLVRPVDRHLTVNAVPLRLGSDAPGAVIVLHDVTELRRLEQVRTEFLANVSHELRTPLTAIHGYLETLLGGALEEPQHLRKFLEIAYRHTERLGRLVGDVTDLSNIELGKVALRPAAQVLGDVIESVLTIMRPRAETAGVTLAADVLPPSLAVTADHDRLAQILLNLVDNGVKYTPRGGSVTVRGRETGSGAVEIGVIDTGIGIPRTHLPRITERFYRVDKARSKQLGGTGLGLAIVKHLVAAHGGELQIESEEGRGTTVRFTLPPAASTGHA